MLLRVLLVTDFTESFAHRLVEGIIKYSRRDQQWALFRMPLAYKKQIGIAGVVKWAKEWKADAVIGLFDETDDVSLFRQNGIIALAQDYKKRFSNIPNITGNFKEMGRMAARFYLERGFRNFGFFGYNDVCWSDERCDGFREEIEKAGYGDSLYTYQVQDIEFLWMYDKERLRAWLRMIPKPIGIMACDDNQGNNLIEACHIVGIKIPSEVSVIGVDNDEQLCDQGSTSLSSIHVDIVEGGYRVAEAIEKMVANPDAPMEDIVMEPVRIINRMSTAAFGTDDMQIRKAILYIHGNYHKKITVNDVVDQVAMSRRLLERRFKDVTGKTLYEYISDLKLKHFAEMLLETDEQIASIALSLGEIDTKSISRRFKQIYGETPLQWREKHRTKTI